MRSSERALALRKLIFIAMIAFMFPSWALSGDVKTPERTFMEGKRLYDSGHFDKALASWKSISTDQLYGPVIYILAASRYMSEKNYSMAETSVRELMKVHPRTPYGEMATSILIDSLVEQGKKEAAGLIQIELNKASDSGKPALLLKMAAVEIKAGNYHLATDNLKKLVVDYPASLEGLRASEILSELAQQHRIKGFKLTVQEEQTRASKLFQSGKFDLAADSYKNLLMMKPDEKGIRLKLARSLYRNRDNQEAIKTLQAHLNTKLSQEEQTEAYYLLSLIYWRLDKDREFDQACRKVLEKGSPKFRKRVTANLAAHNFERGRLSKAETFYNKLLGETTDSVVKADIKWKLAWIKYRNHQYREAAALFAESRRLSTNGKLAGPSKYWEARSLAQAGSEDAASALYRQLISSRTNDYYAIEAARALGLKGLKVSLASMSGKSFPETRLTPAQANMNEVKAALNLLEKELPELALANLRALPRSVKETPQLAILMAKAAQGCGFYGLAHDILYSQFGSMVDEPPESSPVEFVKLAYPKAHVSHTVRQSAQRSVDPFLVWSIMRQESRYDSAAVSPAGAIGLMQVTPDTARKLDSYKPVSNSSLISDLLTPRHNISAAVEILASNLKSFGGNTVAAIASYNADPKKVRDWVRRNGKMRQDEFIENIPFLETRLYVKKVLANLATYKNIHSRTDLAERW